MVISMIKLTEGFVEDFSQLTHFTSHLNDPCLLSRACSLDPAQWAATAGSPGAGKALPRVGAWKIRHASSVYVYQTSFVP